MQYYIFSYWENVAILGPEETINKIPAFEYESRDFSPEQMFYFISMSALPVISSGCGRPISFSTVGATSARMPL